MIKDKYLSLDSIYILELGWRFDMMSSEWMNEI